MRRELESLTAEERRAGDEALFAAFLALPRVEEARTVFAFWGVAGREPETERLIAALLERGKRVGLPRMLPGRQMEVRQYLPGTQTVAGPFGIREPGDDWPLIPKDEVDLVLVPALCYDRRGYRLGYGGGYYDRWLDGHTGFRVGLCRAAFLQTELPAEEFDRRVDVILTEEEILSFPREEQSGA